MPENCVKLQIEKKAQQPIGLERYISHDCHSIFYIGSKESIQFGERKVILRRKQSTKRTVQ